GWHGVYSVPMAPCCRELAVCPVGCPPERGRCYEELRTGHVTDSHDIECLRAKSVLQETVFRSRLPVIGPLIAWLRTAWNSVSTKWYVRPLIAQQSEFNALVVGQLRNIAEQLDFQERQIHDLSVWLIAQDREQSAAIYDLAELRVQLGQLRKVLAEMSAAMPQGDADNERRSG
ncbi:MAG: hypothetical protein ACP5UQ_17470, partial [Anaerolineae bacterium]